MKTKTRKKTNSVAGCSGNVFADMGVAEPEQALAKAELAAKIAIAIEEEQLTQTEAAERLGTDKAKVSAIVRGRLDQFSTERLLHYAQMIGYDVEIRFSRRHAAAGHLRIGCLSWRRNDVQAWECRWRRSGTRQKTHHRVSHAIRVPGRALAKYLAWATTASNASGRPPAHDA